jgi:hypothetical protein
MLCVLRVLCLTAVRGCGAHAARALDATTNSSSSSSSNSAASRVAQLAAVTIHVGMSSSSTLLGVVAQLRQVQRLELLLNAPLSRCGLPLMFARTQCGETTD